MEDGRHCLVYQRIVFATGWPQAIALSSAGVPGYFREARAVLIEVGTLVSARLFFRDKLGCAIDANIEASRSPNVGPTLESPDTLLWRHRGSSVCVGSFRCPRVRVRASLGSKRLILNLVHARRHVLASVSRARSVSGTRGLRMDRSRVGQTDRCNPHLAPNSRHEAAPKAKKSSRTDPSHRGLDQGRRGLPRRDVHIGLLGCAVLSVRRAIFLGPVDFRVQHAAQRLSGHASAR